MTRALQAVLHDGKSAKQALQQLNGELKKSK